jgi:NAD(P)-dependent dehydrogenase (short-subunit alcohol dehydrogenase family)
MRAIRGKHAVVTGAAGGIGCAIATRLAHEGACVALLDRDAAGLEELAWRIVAAGGSCWTFESNFISPDGVRAAVDAVANRWGGADILVNNAGIAYYGPTERMPLLDWNRVMRVNLHAAVELTLGLLPGLLERRGHIANIASITGLVAGPRTCAYAVSKFGLVGFSESLRCEYKRHGLGVSVVCPGPVATGLYAATVTDRGVGIPTPPRWTTCTPERVAEKTLAAIRWNRRQVLVTPMAHGLFQLKRFAPGLLDFLAGLSRKRLFGALRTSDSNAVPQKIAA